MRYLLPLLLLLLVGCDARSIVVRSEPTPTFPIKAATVPLSLLLDDPQRWVGQPVALLTVAIRQPDELRLVRGLRYNGGKWEGVPPVQEKIWLASNLDLRPLVVSSDGTGYLRLNGQLSPAGGYGPGGRYAFQFDAFNGVALQPEQTTLTAVTNNPRSLNDVVMKLQATLLATNDGAILTEQTGAGGVPKDDGRQIKMRSLPDPQVVQQLTTRRDVFYGPVEVIGWWHDGSLLPLAVRSTK
ncbi:MAG: hypothetical protein NVS4B8_20580 [Herpetosiphon sp.]